MIEKISFPTFVPVTDVANACERNLLVTNVHTSRSRAEGGGALENKIHSPTRM